MDWKVQGHDWAVHLLSAHASGHNLRHAYLFVGPQGVGRRTLALRFAQALNCTAPPEPGQFCGQCRHCRQFRAMQHPDLSLLVPEEGHKDILIDQIRELQHSLALAPYSAAYRIALLLDFQRATTQAMNALLKTLEEPQDKVVLLLTADALESLLPTIVSRCEVIRLRPASIASTGIYLQSEKGLSGDEAQFIAHLSGGRVGAALRFIEEPEVLTRRRDALETFFGLFPVPRYERFKYADTLTKSYDTARKNIEEVLPIWLSFWRDVFVRVSKADIPLVNVDLETQVNFLAAALDLKDARTLLTSHEKAMQYLDAYANPRLLIETLMLQWPFITLPGLKE
jgi:DNA polymerase III subunit delta'